jgi:hypothetical protein
LPEIVQDESSSLCAPIRLKRNCWQTLVAEAGAHRHTLAANGATAAQNGCAALGLHPSAKSMRLHTSAAIGLKCALGHEIALLCLLENLALTASPDYIAG